MNPTRRSERPKPASIWRLRATMAVLMAISPALVWSSEGSAQTITVTANPPTLTINTATAGSAPVSASGNGTIRVSNALVGTFRISAALTSGFPAGTTVTAHLTGLGTSAGPVTLTTSPKVLASAIPSSLSDRNGSISYTLSATTAAGTQTLSTRSVTLSIASE